MDRTIRFFRGLCAFCSERSFDSLGHFILIALSGGTTRTNILPVCRICNSRQGGKHPGSLEWMPDATLLYIRAYFIHAEKNPIVSKRQPATRDDVEEMSEELQTLQQVARRLKVTEKTIHRKLESGAISAKFIANRWRFSESDVQTYIRSCERSDNKGIKTKRKYTKRSKDAA